ncbi:5'-methylthioadenosine/S-adenosylhomocysteine nucleosidase [Streptomyces sp. M19]
MLTALQVEYEAMRGHLTDVREIELAQGTRLDVGRIPGLGWQVALAETGPTNTRTALIAQPAIEHFDAEAVFFVGVAGALKDDLRLGDVVVASKIYGYHGGRESADGFNARPVAWEAPHRMDQLVLSARRNQPWAFLAPPPGPDAQPAVRFEPIASGDVLIAFRDSETASRIRRHYNDAVAVDMESHGLAQAARMHGAVKMLAIRGVSDFTGPGRRRPMRAGRSARRRGTPPPSHYASCATCGPPGRRRGAAPAAHVPVVSGPARAPGPRAGRANRSSGRRSGSTCCTRAPEISSRSRATGTSRDARPWPA